MSHWRKIAMFGIGHFSLPIGQIGQKFVKPLFPAERPENAGLLGRRSLVFGHQRSYDRDEEHPDDEGQGCDDGDLDEIDKKKFRGYEHEDDSQTVLQILQGTQSPLDGEVQRP